MQESDRKEPQGSERVGSPRRRTALALAAIVAIGAGVAVRHAHRSTGAPDARPATQQMGAAAAQPLAGPADFRNDLPSPDARLMANWVVGTRDNGQRAFILVDKKDAREYVFTPDGHLVDSAPVLLGEAQGDRVIPGTETKLPSEIKPDEKTTPAGRFVAEPGVNADDEDVIWVDYDAAISMHRVRPAVAAEQRLERLATLTTDDNRISFGCINLPRSFYEDVAKPTVTKYGAIIYVLPETTTVQAEFGAYDVTDPQQVAAARQATVADASRRAAAARAGAQG